MDRMKNGCIVSNMGHSNTEIDVVSGTSYAMYSTSSQSLYFSRGWYRVKNNKLLKLCILVGDWYSKKYELLKLCILVGVGIQ